MEMFQAFGFAEKVLKESYWVNETTFWKPDRDEPRNIIRSGRVQDGLSEMPHTLLNQARVHDMYLEIMRNSPSRLEPDYSLKVLGLTVDPDAGLHPVTITLEHVGPRRKGEVETVQARYVIGCDGARSKVRKAIGGELHGDSANQAWGVMDVLAVTDFPDIRMKSIIQSSHEGNILILPREGGYLVRVYVELDKLRKNERVANRELTINTMIEAANRILQPYIDRCERGCLVVDLRSWPPVDRQVRRCAQRRGRCACPLCLYSGRRLPHAQPEGRARYECLDG